jgi:UDP-GlcNAc:undecaprenyl-phosphate GlcNAc-1-phosphate transferase
MGDAGALFLGVLLATLTVRFEPTSETQIGAYLTPLFLLAVPILDTTVSVISRIRRNISPFQGGQDHLSHRLIRSGIPRKQSAFILWALSAIFATSSLFLSQVSASVSNYLIAVTITLWITLFFKFFTTNDN